MRSGSLNVSGNGAASNFLCAGNASVVCDVDPNGATLIREISTQQLNQTFTTLSLKLLKEAMTSGTNELFLSFDNGVEFAGAASGSTAELRLSILNGANVASGDDRTGTSDTVRTCQAEPTRSCFLYIFTLVAKNHVHQENEVFNNSVVITDDPSLKFR